MRLVHFPYTFVQAPLMTEGAFLKACVERGLRVRQEHLEELRRVRAFVPMYRLMKDVRGAITRSRSARGSPVNELMYTPTAGEQIRFSDPERFLRDPRDENFYARHRYRRVFDGYPVQTSEFLYSPYQLLALPGLRVLTNAMVVRRLRERVHYRLKLVDDGPVSSIVDDDLVDALTILEPYYLPDVRGWMTLPGGEPEEWDEFARTFSPTAALRQLGWEPPTPLAKAEVLLWRAASIDPMARWLSLVRQVRPRLWDELRGDARVAMDFRMAAEMLLRFYEDLVVEETAEPIPKDRMKDFPLQDRLFSNEGIDEVLTDFGLSPHPKVVLVLEGATEFEMVPRAMEELGIPLRETLIRLVDAGGIRGGMGKLDLLATYASAPILGEEIREGVLLTRPPTHFFVVLDPEHRFETAEQRERRRQQWVDSLLNALPEAYRTGGVRAQLERIVTFTTWDGTSSFEFAHFADEEISAAATALRRAKGVRNPNISPEAVKAVRPRGDLATLSKGISLSKAELGNLLWPILKARIAQANSEDEVRKIPIARILLDAASIALHSPPGRTVLSAARDASRQP